MAARGHFLVPRRILCATDFSANSVAALRAASVLARSCGAQVRVLHVAPMDAETLVVDSETQADIDRRLESFTQSAITPAVAVRRVRREGDPCAEIVREVRDEHADLVAMGRHSQSPPELALGSVTEGVARQSPCPIMVVADGGRPFHPRHLLCAVDLGETSRETLAHAAALTAALGADLLVLHVAAAEHAAANPVESGLRITPVEEDASRGLSTLVAETVLPSGRLRQRVMSGEPVPAILDAGREDEIDLIVVGLHAGEVVGRQFLGSTTLHLLRCADCALLLVPPPVLVLADGLDDESACDVVGRPPSRLQDSGRYGADPS